MQKKIKNHLKENKFIYLTWIIAVIIISIIFFLQKVSPFGENSTLTIDFYHQYGPMLAELRERILSGKNLFYSFNMSLGLPFFRNFLNYLASPFNLILLFFSKENILTSFSIIIGLKATFSATTFTYFIKKKFNKNSPLLVILGLLYGFQAYFIAYYWNIMWLDGLIFLPLIILGIEKIVKENKNLLYTISLALMILSNYFIAYMICIFSVIYYIVYLCITYKKTEWKKALKNVGLFVFSSLLAGCLTAFLTLPLAESLSSTSATHDTFPFSRYYQFNFVQFLISHLSGAETAVFKTDITNAPNISCGILSLSLLFLFFTNSQIKFKTKIGYSIIFIIIALSFFLAPLDFIWHGFHVPNDLPYRFSFLYTFTLMTISAYSLIKIKDNKLRYIFLSYILCIGLIIGLKIYKPMQISQKMLNINAILLSIYFVIYLLTYLFPKTKNIMAFIFIGIISTECVIRVNTNWDIDQKIDTFYDDYSAVKLAENFIEENDNSPFYRMEKTNLLTYNDSSWYSYYGITSFSSMTYEKLAILQRDLGLPGNEINSFYYKPNTPIYDLMFNLKYILNDKNSNNVYENNHYDSILVNNKYNVIKNKNNLNLMFGVNESIKKWKLVENAPFLNQNSFIESTTNISNTLERLNPQKKETFASRDDLTIIRYSFNNNLENNYFYTNNPSIEFFIINNILYYNKSQYSSINFTYPTLSYYTSESYDEKKVINFSSHEPIIDIYVGYSSYTEDINLYTLNESKFNDAYNILKNKELEITEFKENKIIAKNNNPETTTVYTSIPYDKGWKVYIDGKKVNTYKNADVLLGFDIPKNSKTIELKYVPSHFYLGSTISLLSLITLIFTHKKKRKV